MRRSVKEYLNEKKSSVENNKEDIIKNLREMNDFIDKNNLDKKTKKFLKDRILRIKILMKIDKK